MCTATWQRFPDGFELFFNRDERLSRRAAEPPRAGESGGRRWLAPVDGDFGGTWISANEAGLALALLNGLREEREVEPSRGFRSRGLLLVDLVDADDPEDVGRRLDAADLTAVRGFRMLAISPGLPASVFEWDRRALVVDRDAEGRLPLVSSSFDESEVGARRRARYRDLVVGAGAPLAEYHHDHRGGPSASSVCMHREDAGTRSFTRIVVDREAVCMHHHEGPPCEPGPESTLRLPRNPLRSRLPGRSA